MVRLREQPTPVPPDTQPPSTEAVFGIRRNEMKSEVRDYADNLRDQVRKIFADHGVKTVDEFSAAARTKKIPLEKVKEVQTLLKHLRAVVDGTMTSEILAQQKEREHLKQERRKQAKTLFDKGWGKELGFDRFDDYLATIPEAPPQPEQWKGRFDRLVFVDNRIPLTKACQLAGIKFGGNNHNIVPFDPEQVQSGVRWMWCQDGRRNHNKSSNDCRSSFQQDEVGLDAFEGLSLYINDPTVINGHYLDLPSSVSAADHAHGAYLCAVSGTPKLHWHWDDLSFPNYGSASRGEWNSLAETI